MILKNLNLINYRNYDECSVDFNKQKTVLIGDNAQGKTNILEAVYYLANLSSFRAKNDKELILWNKDFCRIKGVLNKFDTDIELDIWINPPKKKIVKVNGIKKNKLSEFIENIAVVSFGVDDLLLLRGAPEDRRKWLDTAISQLYPAYFDRLSKYNRIRNQKNNLLKSFGGNTILGESQQATLDVFNDQLVVCGSNILYLRTKYLKEIFEIALKKHLKISEEKEKLSFDYCSTVLGEVKVSEDQITVESIAQVYKQAVENRQKDEIIRAQSLVGPHRDDINFYINKIEAVSFASQGQQRTIVISLKLAELDLIQQKTGENPILLLDDVLAELDGNRQNYLLDSIENNIQTIITSVDANSFKEDFLTDVDIIKIEKGKIV